MMQAAVRQLYSDNALRNSLMCIMSCGYYAVIILIIVFWGIKMSIFMLKMLALSVGTVKTSHVISGCLSKK